MMRNASIVRELARSGSPVPQAFLRSAVEDTAVECLTAGYGELYILWGFGGTLASRLIRYLDRMPDESRRRLPSRWSHVALAFNFVGECWVYESVGRHGVRIVPWRTWRALYGQPGHGWYAHHVPRFSCDVEAIWHKAKAMTCLPYDQLHILGLYCWIRLYGRSATRRPRFLDLARNDRYICAEFTDQAARDGGLDLCGAISTPVTTTPESQFRVAVGRPSCQSVGTGDLIPED